MINLKKVLPIMLSVFVFFELSLLFAATDLKIWVEFGNPTASFALITEILGKLVAPFIFVLSGLIFVFYYNSLPNVDMQKKSQIRVKIYVGYVFCIVGIAYSFFVLTELKNVLGIIIGTILVAGFFTFAGITLKKMPPDKLFYAFCVAVTAVIYCILVLVIVCVLKALWGRVRPRDMKAVTDFSPWYLPQGITGNTSFPSGHTSNAAILYVVTMLAPLFKEKWKKILIYAVPCLWIIFMALTRIICGAHFASDTLFAIAISISLFYVSKKISVRLIAKSLIDE